MKLKTIRWAKGLTQEEAASLLGITRRTYAKYENDESRWYDLKYKFMCQVLEQYGYVDEEHGLLSIEKIKEVLLFTLDMKGNCFIQGKNSTEYLTFNLPIEGGKNG